MNRIVHSLRAMSAAIVNRKWLSYREIWPTIHLLVLAVGLKQYMKDSKLFASRIVLLWQKSGKKFLVLYLKECVRLVLAYLNNTETSALPGGVRVRRGHNGLPTIIPVHLRKAIVSYKREDGLVNKRVVRMVLSVLSLYRMINFPNKPSLASVTNPFSGISTRLPLEEIQRVLQTIKRPKLGKAHFAINESSGPNGPKSTWFAGVDALAYLREPRQWFAFVSFAIRARQYRVVLWFIMIQMLALPLAPFYCSRLKLGKLTALDKDGAGKRRIIAIADYWLQTLMMPVHDSIFSILRNLPQDGTFDQWKPVKEWVIPRLRLGESAYSFDLSNATDRLPIDFQVDVFGHLFGEDLASIWKTLMRRRWWYQGQAIQYAVGQPMGALSSWAMLALSHHVMVQVAALRAGYKGWYPFYAILGDDLVIAGKDVADHYLAVARTLGVEINLNKSLISEIGLLEFAKRWEHPHYGEFSAIGAGLLVGAMRNSYLVSLLALHLFQRDWIAFPEQLREVISALKTQRRNVSERFVALMFATIVGPSGLLRDARHVTAFAEAWFAAITGEPKDSAILFVIEAFRRLVEKDMADLRARGLQEFEYFVLNWPLYPCLGDSAVAGALSVPLQLISPGFWCYLIALWRGRDPSYSASLNLHGLLHTDEAERPGAIKFDLLGLDDMATFEWTRRKDTKLQFTVMDSLIKELRDVIREDQANFRARALTVVSAPLSQAETNNLRDSHRPVERNLPLEPWRDNLNLSQSD